MKTTENLDLQAMTLIGDLGRIVGEIRSDTNRKTHDITFIKRIVLAMVTAESKVTDDDRAATRADSRTA